MCQETGLLSRLQIIQLCVPEERFTPQPVEPFDQRVVQPGDVALQYMATQENIRNPGVAITEMWLCCSTSSEK